MKDNNLSVVEIINYFSDKDAKPYYATKFIKQHGQTSGGYISFANVFVNNEGKVEETKVSKQCDINYNKIINLIENKSLENTDAFNKLTPDFIKNIKVDKKNGEPNQKWHLLVSFYGQYEIENPNSTANIFKESIKCPELWIWILESVKDDNLITAEDIQNLYENAISYKEKKITSKEWQNCFKGYWENIAKIIKANK